MKCGEVKVLPPLAVLGGVVLQSGAAGPLLPLTCGRLGGVVLVSVLPLQGLIKLSAAATHKHKPRVW